MFFIDHVDDHGFTASWPAGRVYAALLARWAGFTGGERAGKWWEWRGAPSNGTPYQASAYGDTIAAKLVQPQRVLTLYLMDPTPHGITCRMLGEAWDDDTLDRLFAHLRPHPYSMLVIPAIIDQADWLDDNPGYRSLPVKHRPHLSPDALEVTP